MRVCVGEGRSFVEEIVHLVIYPRVWKQMNGMYIRRLKTNECRSPLSHSVAAPAIIIAGINAWKLWNEHWSHYTTTPPNEVKIEYPYQNIRVKSFPWGDGDKVRFPTCVLCRFEIDG